MSMRKLRFVDVSDHRWHIAEEGCESFFVVWNSREGFWEEEEVESVEDKQPDGAS
jgi:hypothetical protein